ncbi:hypothetical protein ABKN59_002062 [Abortiporus biennis]
MDALSRSDERARILRDIHQISPFYFNVHVVTCKHRCSLSSTSSSLSSTLLMEELTITSPGPHAQFQPSVTSPRPSQRPSGPRGRRSNFKNAAPLSLNGSSSPSDETVPAYSGRASPALSSGFSSRPQSPTPMLASMPSFSQLSESSFGAASRRFSAVSEKGVQTYTEPPTPLTRASTPAVKLIVKAPTLTPPPALNFESPPVQWKGLTLEAAQYSFTSDQLQAIVSRAIRQTAHESFIRLLSIKTLDEEIAQELARLDALKATTQSQYRFNMHRRTMLLQSLMALASGDGDSAALVSLTSQLAEITVTCDRLMENMLRISDQRAQIRTLQDVHVASALAMALRKLNGSYAKRTTELREARGQIEQLKQELEEAWHVAEDMAQEMDDLDNFHSGFSSDDDDDDEGDPILNDESVRLAEVINITGRAVASKATLHNLPKEVDRMSRVSAAKKRSSRASKASLRIPKSSSPAQERPSSVFSRRSRSKSLRSRTADEPDIVVPPMPAVHLDKPGSSKEDSFLEMSETRPGSPSTPDSAQHPPVPHLPSGGVDEIHAADGDAAADTEDHQDAPTSQRPTTLNFEIPPIEIHSPVDEKQDDQDRKSDKLPARRVRSMQPNSRTRSMDDSDVKPTRPSSEYKRFDGWPWQFGKKSKRHSMPLTRMSLDEAEVSSSSKPPLSPAKEVDESKPTD